MAQTETHVTQRRNTLPPHPLINKNTPLHCFNLYRPHPSLPPPPHHNCLSGPPRPFVPRHAKRWNNSGLILSLGNRRITTAWLMRSCGTLHRGLRVMDKRYSRSRGANPNSTHATNMFFENSLTPMASNSYIQAHVTNAGIRQCSLYEPKQSFHFSTLTNLSTRARTRPCLACR